MRVDLNADVGESFGPYQFGEDAALIPSITSANIAAGFHAGDPSVLRETIRRAKAHNVAVGAHPGFPDLVGFGRRDLHVSVSEAEDFVLYQIAAVAGVAAAEGVSLQHVKPHGALYNMAARDPALAGAIACAVQAFNPALVLVGLPGSELLRAGRDAGLRVAGEAFADRGYRADGSLIPRQTPGAIILDIADVLRRAVRIATHRTVEAEDGSTLTLDIETICIHGDHPGAAALALAVRAGLAEAGVTVRAFGQV